MQDPLADDESRPPEISSSKTSSSKTPPAPMRWIQRVREAIVADKSLLIELAVLALGLVVLWPFGLSLVGDYRIDDAYITFSYSKNLARGLGPIYSYDLQVEGYSNFLWMVLVAVGKSLGAPALATARVLGQFFLGLTFLSVWWWARAWAGRVFALLAVFWLACASDLFRAAQSGLETVAYAGFICAGLCHYSLERPDRRRYSLLWLTLAALTRIDGVFPLGIVVGLELLRWLGGGRKERLVDLARWVAIGLFPVCLYWAWRMAYYELLFPLPYYAKTNFDQGSLVRGSNYVFDALRETGLWAAVLSALLFLGRTPRIAPWIVFAFLSAMVGYVVRVGGDWMPFNRMLLSLYGPLIVLAVSGLASQVGKRVVSFRTAAVSAAALLLVGFSGLHLSAVRVDTPHEERKLALAADNIKHTQKLLAMTPFIRAMVRNPGDRLVTDYGGVFAYFTDASVIEMWGLANKEIALRGNTDGISGVFGKTCIACYPEFQPDYFHVMGPHFLRSPGSIESRAQMVGQIFQGRALDKVLKFRKNYRVGRVVRSATGETLWFLERKRPSSDFDARQVGEMRIDYPRLR